MNGHFMNSPVMVARKELRSSFQSPVALIFLGIFLVLTLFGFFSYSKFFARNLADLRPLFQSLPLLLIFLVSAITMRQWADERKTGTLEVLLTLPIRTWDLVLGKFMAGMLLVALALLLTLPLPITVSQLGDMDLGPVLGGYLAALLLASVYMAIGLCISSRTDNQVVSLMLTLVLGGILYLVGTDKVTGLANSAVAEVLRGLGTGSRFESIERGVIDLRDLFYYLGLTTFFLYLNVYFLEKGRLDPQSVTGRRKNKNLLTTLSLVGFNILLADIWLAPITALRADLTERGEYSISDVTVSTIGDLDEPLWIQGFFSQRTHPLLAPLVPQIRDMLAEYQVAGRGKVEVTFQDPNSDEELEQEINEQYSIRSVPFRVSERHQQSVVNSYFHILVRYGDQYEVLSFDDLIEVQADEDGIDVRLRNLEYDLTRAIRKVSREFTSLEAIFAKLPDTAHITAYISPATLPDDFKEMPETIDKVVSEMVDISRGHLDFKTVDPSDDSELQEQLYSRHSIQPFAADLFGTERFYLHLLLQEGASEEVIFPHKALSEADLKKSLEAAIRRATPGQMKTLGLFTEIPENEPPNPQLPPQLQPQRRQPDYRVLEQYLGENYRVERLQLEDGDVPDYIDILIVGKPGDITEEQRFAMDQYLMRGGSLVALAGNWNVQADRNGLNTVEQDRGLADMLQAWGATIGKSLVMDPENAPFPIPVKERRGPFTMERIELLPYPFFPDIRQKGFARDHQALAGLNNVTVPWVSPLELSDNIEDRDVQVLLSSSPGAWLNTNGDINPDFTKWPDSGFGAEGETRSMVLAVTMAGTFPSFFADRPSPIFDGDG